MASGSSPRKQVEHKTASDRHAEAHIRTCNAGAIHTGRSRVRRDLQSPTPSPAGKIGDPSLPVPILLKGLDDS
jgi:hypothetical protein